MVVPLFPRRRMVKSSMVRLDLAVAKAEETGTKPQDLLTSAAGCAFVGWMRTLKSSLFSVERAWSKVRTTGASEHVLPELASSLTFVVLVQRCSPELPVLPWTTAFGRSAVSGVVLQPRPRMSPSTHWSV